MIEQTISVPARLVSGSVVAVDVSANDYMARYAAEHHEWVKGLVIKMTPISLQHYSITTYLSRLLEAYLALNPIGRVVGEPFVMRLDAVEAIREPDLQVILHTNPGDLTDTAMIGPADICIEVVSAESSARDYGTIFEEYEKSGVGEYWIVDPLRQEYRFYRLSDSGLYTTVPLTNDDHYHTPLLPQFALHVPTLWHEPLPDFFAIGQAVQTMLQQGNDG